MTQFKSIDRDHISLVTGLSGLFLSVAGVIANVIGNQTNFLFWAAVALGGIVIVTGFAMRANEAFFRAIVRPFLGANIISIDSCKDHQVEMVHCLAQKYFGDSVTPVEQIRAIIRRYPEGLQVATVKNDNVKPYIGGYYFYFPIQKSCVDRIVEFKFDVSSLVPDEIADRPDRGYAMYIGAIAGNGNQVRAELMGALKTNIQLALKTRSSSVYARAATNRGKQVLLDYGFTPVHPHAEDLGCFFQRTFQKEKVAVEPVIALGLLDPDQASSPGKTKSKRGPARIRTRRPAEIGTTRPN